MSSPRDRSGDGFEDTPEGWREPDHLGGSPAQPEPGTGEPPAGAQRPAQAPGPDAGAPAWEPPGWSLPSTEPERPARAEPVQQEGASPWPGPPTGREPDAAPPAPVDDPAADRQEPAAGGGGWFGGGRRARARGAADEVFRYQGDLVGAQGWGVQHGWVPSDGTGPEDAVLAELVASAPVRPTKDDRPGNVLRGRYGTLDLVAFDIVYTSGRYAQPRWAVTAAPVLGELPGFRLSPARFWKHGTGGLLHLPSGDPEFDLRWVLLSTEDSPQLRRLVDDQVVRQLLLGSDDGDEFWSAVGHVAAVRPDGHRPELIEHQGRILAAVLGALAAVS